MHVVHNIFLGRYNERGKSNLLIEKLWEGPVIQLIDFNHNCQEVIQIMVKDLKARISLREFGCENFYNVCKFEGKNSIME